jgi:hypothetical protein
LTHQPFGAPSQKIAQTRLTSDSANRNRLERDLKAAYPPATPEANVEAHNHELSLPK